jgi:hemerythrin-like domain-containing protein
VFSVPGIVRRFGRSATVDFVNSCYCIRPTLDTFDRIAMLHHSMKITDILMAEHTVFHSLFDHVEATVPKAKTLAVVKALAVTVQTLTAPHSRTEDELFIKPLEHYFDQIGHQATFHDEHELIERALAGVLKTKDLKLAKKLLLGAVMASRRHFEKEERIVFPMAERVLKIKTLTELGKQWRSRRDEMTNF